MQFFKWLLTTSLLILIVWAISLVSYSNQKIICIDGDTFRIKNNYYRLQHIDTPEKNEPLYQEAKNYTCNYLTTHDITIPLVMQKDSYGRSLISIHDLETELVQFGFAEPFWGKTTKEILDIYINK